MVMCGSTVVHAADRQAKLKELTSEIDMKLYKQSLRDVRASVNKLINKYWQNGDSLEIKFDHSLETKGRPSLWFRAYEMLGDEKYLHAGLDYVDAIIETPALQRGFGLITLTPGV